jgi:hypothetical protein|tara:strand:- start:453 stop:638 length:186 start_codon:yes stop_codon:yes gene_type:complete
MALYKIDWTEEQWFRVDIEAENRDEAMAKFLEGEYENEEMYGSETQDSVEISMRDDEFEQD